MKHGWTIGRKLVAAFLCVAALTLLLGGVGYYGVVQGGKAIDEIAMNRLPAVASLLTIKEGATAIKGTQQALLDYSRDAADRKQQLENVAKIRGSYEAAWKVYEPLAKTAEEGALWSKVTTAWQDWRKENTEFFRLSAEFDKLGVEDPDQLRHDLAIFRGDHYRLVTHVLENLRGGAAFDGGEDPAKCNFGKWLATFSLESPEIRVILQDMAEPHRRFHATVAKAKASKGADAAALAALEKEAVAGSEEFCQYLDKLRAKADQAAETSHQARKQFEEKCLPTQLAANDLVEQLVKMNQNMAAESSQQAVSRAGFLKLVQAIAVTIGVVAALGLGILISRGINKVLARIAGSLGEGAEQTASASEQVSSASQSLAQGASEQAAAIEETSSSLEEMSSMTKRNASNAQHANQLMAETRELVTRGQQSMSRLSGAIEEIKKSSDQTAKIVKTIDEIAFQTNLLALNAAVEAARAGDAGKGFAVVAEEVRNLAQRAGEAARNTAALIEGSVKNSENGVSVAGETAHALEEITAASEKVRALIGEIAAASNEQSQGIEQVTTAVSQMDQVTQQNAANAEESASASEELSAQAEQLRGMVQELIALVRGNGDVQGSPATHKTERIVSRAAAPAAAGKRAAKPAAVSATDHLIHDHLIAKPGPAAGKRPADVIPLNEHEELAKF